MSRNATTLRFGPVDQATGPSKMTRFADNIGRIRIIDMDRTPFRRPSQKFRMHESVHV